MATHDKVSGGRTIEVSEEELRAYLENLADEKAVDAVVVPTDAPRATAPPPLPKRRIGPLVLTAVLVILVCAVLGIGAGWLLGSFGSPEAAAVPTAPTPSPPETATAIVPLDEIVVEAAPDAGP
jgi:hypothetical protein